jgi:hypothetical protein
MRKDFSGPKSTEKFVISCRGIIVNMPSVKKVSISHTVAVMENMISII